VDAAYAGGTVVVSDGVYGVGGRVVYGSMTNRVAVTKPLTVQAVNAPTVTVIKGARGVRCVYLTNNAALTGFTLSDGATPGNGGGVYCESTSVLVSNCVLTANSAGIYGNSSGNWGYGGGAYSGTLNGCTLTGNSSGTYGYGGGAYNSILNSCTLAGSSGSYFGGGACNSTLNNCSLTGNSAPYGGGGGASWCTLNDCILSSNSASDGGGTYSSTVSNCTLTNNSATLYGGGDSSSTLSSCILSSNSAGISGGGAFNSTAANCTLTGNFASAGGGARYGVLKNCIVYYNSAPSSPNHSSGGLSYCCTEPLPNGSGNFTNAPLFVDYAAGNLRLQTNSPCINAGNNAYAPSGSDLDGNRRIAGGTVDMGAYEFQGTGLGGFTAWLWQYGLRIDGTADYADADFDGMNNWQEWRCGTDPTNGLSVLQMLSPTNDVSGLVVSWQSVTNRTYFLDRSTDLGAQPAFQTLATNIVGQTPTTSHTDTNAVGVGPFFYRVGVEP
jgi:hypothetical protein